MDSSDEAVLQPLFPYTEVKKGTLTFDLRNFDHHYGRLLQIIPEDENLLCVMPAYISGHTGAVHGCMGLTEGRVIFSGGLIRASLFGSASTLDRPFQFIKSYFVNENEQLGYLAFNLVRTKDFNSLSSTSFDSIKVSQVYREDLLKFASNAKVLSSQLKK